VVAAPVAAVGPVLGPVVGSALHGAGTAGWMCAAAGLHAAAVGTDGWRGAEPAAVIAGALALAAAAARRRRSERCATFASAALVAAAAGGVAACALLRPAPPSGPGAFALLVPLFAAGVDAGCRAFATRPRAWALGALAAVVCVAAGAFSIPSTGTSTGASTGTSLGAFALLAAAALAFCAAGVLGGRAGPAVAAFDTAPRPAAAMALLLGALAVPWLAHAPPRAAAAAPALAFGAASLLPVAAANAARIAVLAAGGVVASLTLAPAWGHAAAAVAAGLALAVAFAGGRAAAARCLAAGAFGAVLAAALLGVAREPAAAVAGAAAVALFALRRDTVLALPAALLCAAASAAAALWPRPDALPEGERALLALPPSTASYRERDQALVLRRGGAVVDLAGPDQRHADLLAGLLRCALPHGGRVLLCGQGTGRLGRALADAPGFSLRAVDAAPLPPALARALAQDGPVTAGSGDEPAPAVPRVWIGGRRAFLWAQHRGAADAVAVAEPLLGDAPVRASVDEQQALRHAAGDGLVLQPFLLAATPPPLLAALLAAAAAAHPWCGVLLADGIGVVVGSGAPLSAERLAAGYALLPAAERWRLHAVHIGAADDFATLLLGVVPPAAAGPRDDELLLLPPAAADAAAAAAVLRAALGGAPSVPLLLHGAPGPELTAAMQRAEELARVLSDGVLPGAELERARWRLAEAQLLACDPQQPQCTAEAAALAAQFLPRGCPRALLQAALALPDANGQRQREPAAAAALALAIDPACAATAPPVLAPVFAAAGTLPSPRSPLLDLRRLPAPELLAQRCVGGDPSAVALRARFPSECAAALVAAWGRAPLPAPALLALRELADPFVLNAAATALAARRARVEVLLAFAVDLPTPLGVAELAHGTPAERAQLCEALAWHRDARAIELLAAGLDDPDVAVRRSAGAAVAHVAGGRVPYDPEWQQSARLDAAARLRALHNPPP
jgi:hypothetical protein